MRNVNLFIDKNLPRSDQFVQTLNTAKERIPSLHLFYLSKMNEIKPTMSSEKETRKAECSVKFDGAYFCPDNIQKGNYIKRFFLDGVNILLDDFDPNLEEWETHGHKFKAVKFVNNIDSKSEQYPNVFEDGTDNFVTIIETIVNDYYDYTPKYKYKIFDLQKRQYRDEVYDSYNEAVKDFATYWREINFDSDLVNFDDDLLLESIPKEYHKGILNLLDYINSISSISKRNHAAVSLWQDLIADEDYIEMCDFKVDKVQIN